MCVGKYVHVACSLIIPGGRYLCQKLSALLFVLVTVCDLVVSTSTKMIDCRTDQQERVLGTFTSFVLVKKSIEN